MSLTDGGYLDDPEAEWGRFSNPDVVPFDTIPATPQAKVSGRISM